MSKPSTYFSIREHAVYNKRSGKDDTDHVLFFQEDAFECRFKWGRYNAESTKNVRSSILKELAKRFDEGKNSHYFDFFLQENNLTDLQKILHAHRIEVTDFAQWVSDQVKEIWPAPVASVAGSSGTGTRTTTGAVKLASIINKYFSDLLTDGQPDNQKRADALKALVTDENLAVAVKWLDTKKQENGWNQTETMQITDPANKSQKKTIKNPAYGQVNLQNRS